MAELMKQLHGCHAREAALMSQAAAGGASLDLLAELRRLNDAKRELLDALLAPPVTLCVPPPVVRVPPPPPPQLLQLRWAGAERYECGSVVQPPPVVTIADWPLLSRSVLGAFVLTASLVSSTEGSVPCSAPLEGLTSHPVAASGVVAFPDLRLPHILPAGAYLCLRFVLEQHTDASHLISSVLSAPFLLSPSPSSAASSSSPSASSGLPTFTLSLAGNTPPPPFTLWPRRHSSSSSSLSSFASSASLSVPSGRASLRASGSSSESLLSASSHDDLETGAVCADAAEAQVDAEAEAEAAAERELVDITELLLLPQRTAAERLGVSESLLCKRFKESTRRKWPYRSVQKLDRLIAALRLALRSDGALNSSDHARLAHLVSERERCLRPVRIRVDRPETHALESLQLLASNAPLK